ncbi:unnamed protein product [Oncorhynchus mykiss]|uniref:Uncharacterized protein n=1 Tax=Oncorhynchus mykiss TaxID=8022 RepID=A0A060ZEE0_ONCMY|nr:unnamed protein product [Oncorhynchus mykiss]
MSVIDCCCLVVLCVIDCFVAWLCLSLTVLLPGRTVQRSCLTWWTSAKRKAAVWPLQIILLILCPDITQDISRETVEDTKVNKKLFLENLRKALAGHGGSKQLTESAAIACVKLCKASTYINWEDHSVIFLLVQSIVVDLKALLFNPTKPFSRGAGSQNADVDLMIDCFVSCFRINPHNNQHFKVFIRVY